MPQARFIVAFGKLAGRRTRREWPLQPPLDSITARRLLFLPIEVVAARASQHLQRLVQVGEEGGDVARGVARRRDRREVLAGDHKPAGRGGDNGVDAEGLRELGRRARCVCGGYAVEGRQVLASCVTG